MSTPPPIIPPVTKGADWMLCAETAEGAPEGIFGAQCLRCGDECWWDDDRRPVDAWMIDHTRTDPAHHQFRFTAERFCRVGPVPPPRHGATQVVATAPTSRLPAGVAAHARPRTPRRTAKAVRRALARVGRHAGPLFLVLLTVGSTALGALFAAGPGR
ncbi:hypothetical protein [Streptomyces sp. XD-27]|uniref:DUF7848 domain-containing protein n=1 Tax=Streptomyces sp. XD-27 TaxID=3062779 RepID=UPI0026F47401|nr:hypothetical protein [Streptomyces sp. XD-27]WKX70999.1 hypothetical protein Q3Y56_14740 [Streptomyces sp. XD-27]